MNILFFASTECLNSPVSSTLCTSFSENSLSQQRFFRFFGIHHNCGLFHHFSPPLCHNYTIWGKKNQGGKTEFPGNYSVFPFYRVIFRNAPLLFALVLSLNYFFTYNYNFLPFTEEETRHYSVKSEVFPPSPPFPLSPTKQERFPPQRKSFPFDHFVFFSFAQLPGNGFWTRTSIESRALPLKGMSG